MNFTKPDQNQITRYINIISIVILLGVIGSVGCFYYLFSQTNSLSTRISELDTKLASTTSSLQYAISLSHNTLTSALSAEQQNSAVIREQLGGFQNQVGSLSGTLSNLQKLSRTDPELLKKYSKVYFLNENYVPVRLAEIPDNYAYSSRKKLLIHTDVLPHLQAMIDAATSAGIKLYAFSAYRSFAEQRALKGDYTVTYGAGTANSFAADQGYSEHQLGTALDMITAGLGGAIDDFDGTSAYTWMQNNAFRYGFILSYPKGNGYYVYEPWHWRFVGVKLATDLHNQGKTYYSLDQRTLDDYLISIFD